MSTSNTNANAEFYTSETAFIEQTASTREALKLFKAVSSFKAAGPARAVLEELVDVTVCRFHLLKFFF